MSTQSACCVLSLVLRFDQVTPNSWHALEKDTLKFNNLVYVASWVMKQGVELRAMQQLQASRSLCSRLPKRSSLQQLWTLGVCLITIYSSWRPAGAALMWSSVLKPLLKKDVVDYGIINSECVAHALSDILFSMRENDEHPFVRCVCKDPLRGVWDPKFNLNPISVHENLFSLIIPQPQTYPIA